MKAAYKLGLALAIGLVCSIPAFAQNNSGPPISGDMREFTPSSPPKPAPALSFIDGNGGEVNLGDFHGKVVLLNIWATWCGPCVQELPSLDRLAKLMDGNDFTVLAIAVDRDGRDKVAPFMAGHKITHLGLNLDPHNNALRIFHLNGLPTTILIDRDGNEVGRLQGGTEWDGPEAQALVDYYIRRQSPNDPVIQRIGYQGAGIR